MISGNNSYTGGTTVIGGTLTTASNVEQYSSVAIMPGATLDLRGHSVLVAIEAGNPDYLLSIAGSGAGGGAIVNSGGTGTLDAEINLAADTTIGGTSPWSLYSLVYNTGIEGNGYSLTKTGNSVISLGTSAYALSVTGVKNINVDSGVLDCQMGLDNSVSGSVIVNSGGTLGIEGGDLIPRSLLFWPVASWLELATAKRVPVMLYDNISLSTHGHFCPPA